mmetsp:Transcript_104105/g.294624  ORF Transcript_104105/g.294624 Transcript_104105/m.294624 type:complete len:317 (-) Transcript_104105:86-1036(-)
MRSTKCWKSMWMRSMARSWAWHLLSASASSRCASEPPRRSAERSVARDTEGRSATEPRGPLRCPTSPQKGASASSRLSAGLDAAQEELTSSAATRLRACFSCSRRELFSSFSFIVCLIFCWWLVWPISWAFWSVARSRSTSKTCNISRMVLFSASMHSQSCLNCWADNSSCRFCSRSSSTCCSAEASSSACACSRSSLATHTSPFCRQYCKSSMHSFNFSSAFSFADRNMSDSFLAKRSLSSSERSFSSPCSFWRISSTPGPARASSARSSALSASTSAQWPFISRARSTSTSSSAACSRARSRRLRMSSCVRLAC